MADALPAHVYVNTDSGLSALCGRLSAVPYIVLDTEFIRERTYRPELCLVQVKHGDTLAIVDTLAISNLTPLIELLLDPAIVKVVHAATQDLEIFYLLAKRVPAPIFDTQVAAPLLGYAEQIGYGNLVREHLGVDLAKSQTRSDWTRRPLPHRQLAYALDDVIYLEQLYLDMRAKLTAAGRLEWLQNDFDALSSPDKYDQPAQDRWKRIRQIQRYRGPTLAVIQALAEWREINAQEQNVPRNWLLKDDVLVNLANRLPVDPGDLERIRGLDSRTRNRHGQELLALIAEARTQDPRPVPKKRPLQKLDAENMARMQLLAVWVQQRAIELDIHAGLLCPPALLERLVTSRERKPLEGWRDGLLGGELMALLRGEASLRIGSRGIEFHPVE